MGANNSFFVAFYEELDKLAAQAKQLPKIKRREFSPGLGDPRLTSSMRKSVPRKPIHSHETGLREPELIPPSAVPKSRTAPFGPLKPKARPSLSPRQMRTAQKPVTQQGRVRQLASEIRQKPGTAEREVFEGLGLGPLQTRGTTEARRRIKQKEYKETAPLLKKLREIDPKSGQQFKPEKPSKIPSIEPERGLKPRAERALRRWYAGKGKISDLEKFPALKDLARREREEAPSRKLVSQFVTKPRAATKKTKSISKAERMVPKGLRGAIPGRFTRHEKDVLEQRGIAGMLPATKDRPAIAPTPAEMKTKKAPGGKEKVTEELRKKKDQVQKLYKERLNKLRKSLRKIPGGEAAFELGRSPGPGEKRIYPWGITSSSKKPQKPASAPREKYTSFIGKELKPAKAMAKSVKIPKEPKPEFSPLGKVTKNIGAIAGALGEAGSQKAKEYAKSVSRGISEAAVEAERQKAKREAGKAAKIKSKTSWGKDYIK